MTQENNYKGFDTFNDIEDINLRNRNRAVVMANLCEDNKNKEGRVSGKGAALVLGYYAAIPIDERDDVLKRYKENMEQRGFVIAG
jgi:hypothetical protein